MCQKIRVDNPKFNVTCKAVRWSNSSREERHPSMYWITSKRDKVKLFEVLQDKFKYCCKIFFIDLSESVETP